MLSVRILTVICGILPEYLFENYSILRPLPMLQRIHTETAGERAIHLNISYTPCKGLTGSVCFSGMMGSFNFENGSPPPESIRVYVDDCGAPEDRGRVDALGPEPFEPARLHAPELKISFYPPLPQREKAGRFSAAAIGHTMRVRGLVIDWTTEPNKIDGQPPLEVACVSLTRRWGFERRWNERRFEQFIAALGHNAAHMSPRQRPH